MQFKCDCTGHILKIEDMRLKDCPALSFQIYDIYSAKGRKLKKPRLLGDVVIMNNKYPKEYDNLVKFIFNHQQKYVLPMINREIKEARMDSIEKGATLIRPRTSEDIPMKWTKITREDGRIEYVCEHGVGHGNHVHGCDSCCRRKDYPGRK